MLIDGKEIAADILKSVTNEVLTLNRKPKMVAVTCAPHFETKKYLEMKTKRAAAVGIELVIMELPFATTTEMLVASVKEAIKIADGVVVQLPLPDHIDSSVVLGAVPADKDPDGFLYGEVAGACFSPVVGAIDEISRRYKIDWQDKKVVVLGAGRLVGKPAAIYADAKGGKVTVLTKEQYDESELKAADIVISGIGQSHFIKPEMIKEDVIVFDAGTSEDGGALAGDVSSEVASKASLLTPVPGGIGPITIAYLLHNLVHLAKSSIK